MLMPRTSSRRYMSEQEGISMIMVNTEEVPGRTITKTLGVVSGSTVRAKHVGKDIGAFFKNIGGGELKAYTELLGESRDQAVQRMLEEAVGRGANAVVNVRIATSAITPGASEILAYGTAVVVE
jgi:uncharacterized protein YbjQ (UPF0145 family)